MKRKIFAAAFAVCLLACSAVNVFASSAKFGGNGLYMDVFLESSWGTGSLKTKGYLEYGVDSSASYEVSAEKLFMSISAYDGSDNFIANEVYREEGACYDYFLAITTNGSKTRKHTARYTIYEDGRPRYKTDLVNNRDN